jgi:ketosteroid isomerase-like protein
MSGTSVRCPACGADWISEAAIQLIAREQRCLRCGVRLALDVADNGESPAGGADNLALARRAYEAFTSGDRDALLELQHPEVVLESDEPGHTCIQSTRGREELLRSIEEAASAWDELEVAADEWRSLGDRVLVTGRLSGRRSGRSRSIPAAAVLGFNDGRLSSISFQLSASAVEAPDRD